MPAVVARGRDISSYDSGVNYHAYDFLIGKFSEGATFVSPGALDRARATRAAGKVFSAYHYAQPGNGAVQANHFLAVQQPVPGDMPGWLDYEVDGLGRTFFEGFCSQYRSRVGRWPGLYTYLSRFNSEGMRSWLKPGQLLWMARYGAAAAGTDCDIWQWQGGPDLNVAYTPLSKMIIRTGTAQESEPDMSMVTLSGNRVAVVTRGTDSAIYVRVLDHDAGAITDWHRIPVQCGSPVDACTRTGDDLSIVTLAPNDHSVLYISIGDAENPGDPYVQDLGGTGIGGAPGITANGDDLFLSVAGTGPKTGEIYLNRWNSAERAWRGWWDASGRAL